MKYLQVDESRKYGVIFLGRVAIDFNPAYSDEVKEEFKPLKNVHYFEKYVGGSPANLLIPYTFIDMCLPLATLIMCYYSVCNMIKEARGQHVEEAAIEDRA